MQGMVELGEEIFHMPVRLGVPRYIGGLSDVVHNPRYATAWGCCWTGWSSSSATRDARAIGFGFKRRCWNRMKDMVSKEFLEIRQGQRLAATGIAVSLPDDGRMLL